MFYLICMNYGNHSPTIFCLSTSTAPRLWNINFNNFTLSLWWRFSISFWCITVLKKKKKKNVHVNIHSSLIFCNHWHWCVHDVQCTVSCLNRDTTAIAEKTDIYARTWNIWWTYVSIYKGYTVLIELLVITTETRSIMPKKLIMAGSIKNVRIVTLLLIILYFSQVIEFFHFILLSSFPYEWSYDYIKRTL